MDGLGNIRSIVTNMRSRPSKWRTKGSYRWKWCIGNLTYIRLDWRDERRISPGFEESDNLTLCWFFLVIQLRSKAWYIADRNVGLVQPWLGVEDQLVGRSKREGNIQGRSLDAGPVDAVCWQFPNFQACYLFFFLHEWIEKPVQCRHYAASKDTRAKVHTKIALTASSIKHNCYTWQMCWQTMTLVVLGYIED